MYIYVCLCVQIGDDVQVSRSSQAEQDSYEMQVRAANIVSWNVVIVFYNLHGSVKITEPGNIRELPVVQLLALRCSIGK